MSCPRCDQTDFAAFASDPRAPEWSEMRDHYPRCPECSAEVARWSRLTGALAEGRTRDAHPTEARLLAYQSRPGSLAPDERAALEAHLEGCAPCRSEIALLARFDFAALSADAPEAVRREASAHSLAVRLGELLDALGERLFGGVARPVMVAAALLVLALPAALVGWWAVTRQGPAPSPAPIARRESPPVPDTPPIARPPVTPPAPAPEPERIAQLPAPVPEPSEPLAPESPAPESPTAEPDRIARESTPAENEPTSTPEPPAPLQIAALLPSELPVYQPDPMLAGGSLASMRVEPLVRAGAPGGPEIFALGPDHVGATRREGPVLYWFLSGESLAPVELSISAENGIEPLLELRLEPPVAAGLHALDLADHGVVLAPGITHRWFATIVHDPEDRDADVTSGAAVRRTPGGAALETRLESAGPAEQAHVLAAFGYWYDAFDTLSAWSAAEPGAEALRRHRAALLEQVGLAGVARAALP